MSRSLARPAGIAAVAAALLLAVTAIWYALYANGVTVPASPGAGTPDEIAAAYYHAWFPSVADQDLAIRLLAAVAFTVVAAMGALMARSSTDRTSRYLAGWAMCGAGLLGVTSFLVQYGGHGAVRDAGQTQTAVQTIGFVAYVVDTVAAALLLGAYTLIGMGLLAAGGVSVVQRATSVAAGIAVLLLALATLTGDPLGYLDAVRLLVAVVLFPAWAITQLMGATEPDTGPSQVIGSVVQVR